MPKKRLLSWMSISVLAIFPLTAQTTITIGVTGTLGPILQGSDPANLNGRTGTLTVKVSESATPVVSNASLAVYVLPAGAVTDVIGSQAFTTTTPAKMIIQLGSTADVLTVIYASQNDTTTRFVAFLASGSFTSAALMHPTPFSPSPQTLTSATSSPGAGSHLSYADAGVLTVLGFTGSISNSAK